MGKINLPENILVQIVLYILAIENAIIRIVRFILWPAGRPGKIEHFCIHRVGQIGDMVCALPVIHAVRQEFPSVRITLLSGSGGRTNPGIENLKEALPWIDALEIYYSEDISNISGVIALCRQLRITKVDCWIALPQDTTSMRTELRNMVFAKLSGARWAYGFRINTLKYFMREQARNLEFRSETDVLLDIWRELGFPIDNDQHGICIPENLTRSTLGMFKERRFFYGGPLLGLAPGSNRLSNRWSVKRFQEIATLWCEKGGRVVVIGGPSDVELGEKVVESIGDFGLNLCGKTTLVESAAVLQECKVMLTNDSGPMHLASAVGTHCVVTFSARDFPGKWYPRGSGHVVLRKNIECSPCLAEKCDFDNQCMNDISTEEVWREVKCFLRPKEIGLI